MNYGDGESDFKRKAADLKENHNHGSDDEEEADTDLNKSTQANDYFIKELLSERVQMEGKYPHADRLLQQGRLLSIPLPGEL